MRITSVFNEGAEIPERYTCLGLNISFPAQLSRVPENAESLVLIFEDLDATPVPWTHWLVFNIPSSSVDIAEGQVPEDGTEGLANNHSFGYEGPCPRYFKGIHHYRLTVFALDIMLPLPAASERKEIEAAMENHILDTGELTGTCTSGAASEKQ